MYLLLVNAWRKRDSYPDPELAGGVLREPLSPRATAISMGNVLSSFLILEGESDSESEKEHEPVRVRSLGCTPTMAMLRWVAKKSFCWARYWPQISGWEVFSANGTYIGVFLMIVVAKEQIRVTRRVI
jgi:hypothetical protein